MVVQLLLTLSSAGDIIAELPGANGARRQIPINDLSTIRRILQAQQLSAERRIGHDAAPTVAQVRDWETVINHIAPKRLAKSSEWGEELGL